MTNGSKAKLSITNASHDHIANLNEVVELNKDYDFKVLDFNTDYSRIDIGLKQLKEHPLDKFYKELNLGDIVEGEVVKILSVGAVIKLDNGATAMAITKENSDRANVATHHLYKLNSRVRGVISYLDKDAHKINIQTSLKRDD